MASNLNNGLLFFFWLFLSCCCLVVSVQANHGENIAETYDEQLIIRPLDRGQISAYFQFKTFVPTNLNVPYGVNAGRHNDIFPLSLLRLFHQHEIQELHLSLSKGLWKYDLWGLPIRDTPPNAHLWAWFTGYLNAQENWRKLTSLLSGQFCASINLINPTVTIRPKMSYRPFLQQSQQQQLNLGTTRNQQYGYLAALPQEAICTENLTPWTKLLPCRSKKGLGNLLVATKLFNSRYFSMSLDFKFSCSDITNCQNTTGIELIQNIQVVFDAPVDSYNWALSYLFSNSVNSRCPLSSSSDVYIDVTGLEQYQLKVAPTGFVRLNGGGVDNSKFSMSLVDSSSEEDLKSNQSNRVYAYYNLKDQLDQLASKQQLQQNSDLSRNSPKVLNIGITHSDQYQGVLPHKTDFSTVQVRRQARGYGVLSGGLSIFLTNQLPTDIYAIYMDMIPWYLRMYLHTLAIECRPLSSNVTDQNESYSIEPTIVHYEPARDRVRPHHLELLLRLPARSLVEIRFEYEHQFLLWTEYPPDPNHGLYINPATVTFFFDDVNSQLERFLPHLFSLLKSPKEEAFPLNGTETTDIDQRLSLLERFMPLRLHTEPILISMPTPDFSMPYNVVCLVSTVLSIAFGPIYNLTTRRTQLIRKYFTTDNNQKKEEDTTTTTTTMSAQTIPKQID